MAKPIWVRLDRNTGSGNGTVANSSNPHTGRVARKVRYRLTVLVLQFRTYMK